MYKFRIHACLFMLAFAQISSAQDVVWRKLVAREIKVSGKEDKRPHNPTLLDMLVSAVQSGKLAAYSGIDNKFTGRLTLTEFNQTIGSYQPDTVAITDPLTGKETIKIIKHDIDQDAITKYRILEEWSFDKAHGITNIRIIGIAPLMDVYGNDFEAVKILFWLKYIDAADVVIDHARKHPEKALTALIWKDYLGSDATRNKPPVNTWYKRASRILDIDPEDTARHHLKDMGPDSSLFAYIVYKVEHNHIDTYDSSGKKVSHWTILPPEDTITLIDPVTGNEVIKIIKHELYGLKVSYRLIEEWSFDETTGNTQVKISNLVPFIKRNGNEDIYWLKFQDISGIWARYEQSHYNNSLANLLWDDYFLKEEATPKKK